MRLLRRPFACSWRSLVTCNTTAAIALFLYSRARRTSSSIWLSLLVFSLSLCVSFETRFVFAGDSSLRLVFSSFLVLLSPLPALCSRLCSSLCSASVSSLPRLRLSLVECDFYILIFNDVILINLY